MGEAVTPGDQRAADVLEPSRRFRDAVVVLQREMVEVRCGEDATVRHLERVSLKLGEVAGARCIAAAEHVRRARAIAFAEGRQIGLFGHELDEAKTSTVGQPKTSKAVA